MQITDTTPSLAPNLVKDNWSFLEVWVDPMQSPPYVLLLLGDEFGNCHVFDPAKSYERIKVCPTYEEAQLWLLEDEYEPLEGRLPAFEVNQWIN
jgi:hypothetical protein